MHNTTPALSSLESIDAAALLFVSGGCHHGCCPCPQPASQQQQTIVVPQQMLPQAPAPAPAASPQGSTGDVVTTNVSINGQPVS